jgi:flagellar biosynthesis chaperone FliJ
MDYIKVKDKDNLVRDSYSNGIVNTDYNSYNKYLSAYENRISSQNKLNEFEKDMIQLRNDIEEIKTLLRNLSK